jgi:transmembrane sensor
MEEQVKIAGLVIKSLRNELSQQEADELESWKNASADNAHFIEQVTSDEQLLQGLRAIDGMQDERLWEKIHAGVTMDVPVIAMESYQRPLWVKWVAAASITAVVAIGGYMWLGGDGKKPVAKTDTQDTRFKNDIAPGEQKAVLTLSDGRKIVLDNAAGTVAQQGGSVVKNENGELVYDDLAKKGEVLYNTLSTARGQTYPVTLADGSKVWLNSASSIRYPVAFNGNERVVEITGEAYFEVKRNPEKPFRVSILPPSGGSGNHAVVEVLGTHFNVMAYEDENSINTTLLEGSVKFIKDGQANLLKPGQQVQLKDNGQRKVISEVDTEQVVAWKNGYFQFDGATIEEIMRTASRWYDMEVSYEGGKVNRSFVATVSRNTPISKLLQLLEMTDRVHFKVEGKKVIVTP